MKHRFPQFNTREVTVGPYKLTIATPRRPMPRSTWALSYWHCILDPEKNKKFMGLRILGVEFQITCNFSKNC
jgi:hypothetical protein